MNILFVCSSNICRSPYSEFVFRRLVAESPELQAMDISVKSAAVELKHFRIHKKAAAALAAEGFSAEEIAAHRPCFILENTARFRDADIIIGMTKSHRLFTPYPYKRKFLTLSEAVDGGRYTPIPDPFLKKTQEEYNECMQTLRSYLVRLADPDLLRTLADSLRGGKRK